MALFLMMLTNYRNCQGVGRKTANVIASVVFNKPAMAVDTHVFRVSARIGLTTNAKNPLEAERQLVKHIPEEKIPLAHHWLSFMAVMYANHADPCVKSAD